MGGEREGDLEPETQGPETERDRETVRDSRGKSDGDTQNERKAEQDRQTVTEKPGVRHTQGGGATRG